MATNDYSTKEFDVLRDCARRPIEGETKSCSEDGFTKRLELCAKIYDLLKGESYETAQSVWDFVRSEIANGRTRLHSINKELSQTPRQY